MKNSLAIIGFYIIRAFAFLHCTKLLNVVYFQALLYMYIYNFLKTPRLYIIYFPKIKGGNRQPNGALTSPSKLRYYESYHCHRENC